MARRSIPRFIVKGQRVPVSKQERTIELRRRMTSAEIALWDRLRGNRLGRFHFRRQQYIDGFIADFYCFEAGLIIEVDGEIHESQREYDAARTDLFQRRGLRVIRVTNEDVLVNVDATLSRIKAACEHDEKDGQ